MRLKGWAEGNAGYVTKKIMEPYRTDEAEYKKIIIFERSFK